MIDRIWCIGKDPSLVAETLAEARAQAERQIAELEKEGRVLDRDLDQHQAEIRGLVAEPGHRTERTTGDSMKTRAARASISRSDAVQTAA